MGEALSFYTYNYNKVIIIYVLSPKQNVAIFFLIPFGVASIKIQIIRRHPVVVDKDKTKTLYLRVVVLSKETKVADLRLSDSKEEGHDASHNLMISFECFR